MLSAGRGTRESHSPGRCLSASLRPGTGGERARRRAEEEAKLSRPQRCGEAKAGAEAMAPSTEREGCGVTLLLCPRRPGRVGESPPSVLAAASKN